ncbi:MAG: hypothetical protein M1812_002668 [Candelaria pacifica]|nr:MAG: hypothetical protein M1812_002668 [Candelaria pacifica]
MPVLQQYTQLIGRQQAQVGVLPPPPGVQPNFVNPESSAHGLVAVISVFLVFTILFVGARFYTKIFISHSVGWDDYTSLFALVLSITDSAIVLNSEQYNGLGHHMWDVPAQLFSSFMKYSLAESVLYTVSIFLAKLSILIMFLHLFGINVAFKRVLYGIIMICSIYTTINTFLIIFECNPVNKAWNIMAPGSCPVNIVVLAIANGAINIATDFAILVLPVPMIWRLRLPLRVKLAVVSIFMTGMFGCVVAIIRQIAIVSILGDTDVTWRHPPVLMWLIIENNICIICGCAPVLKPLFKRALRHESRLGTRPSNYMGNSILSGRHTKSNPISSSKPSRSMESQLVDADYIELGGDRGSNGISGLDHKTEVNTMARTENSVPANGRILKTETFDVSDAGFNPRRV